MEPEAARLLMVERQIAARGVHDQKVLEVMRDVPREAFVPESLKGAAYDDSPLPIGFEQTISQPYIVALMTSLLELKGDERVLEIGTGSGYQTAILARLAGHVYSAELEASLLEAARARIAGMGLSNVTFRRGDGLEVFDDEAPFDCILCAAAPVRFPEGINGLLVDGGRSVMPVGGEDQMLYRLKRRGEIVDRLPIVAVRFVPLRRDQPK
ncbi:MAG TPA: protein-L-isoaspartate(D-aspartate) O-methyltransferase [Thermoanaerobaculia bacterium]|nr:protein-L-isoaspartate(D-aspartate) O-methyltransferase [Thermoanaerobaculia bacterium]